MRGGPWARSRPSVVEAARCPCRSSNRSWPFEDLRGRRASDPLSYPRAGEALSAPSRIVHSRMGRAPSQSPPRFWAWRPIAIIRPLCLPRAPGHALAPPRPSHHRPRASSAARPGPAACRIGIACGTCPLSRLPMSAIMEGRSRPTIDSASYATPQRFCSRFFLLARRPRASHSAQSKRTHRHADKEEIRI